METLKGLLLFLLDKQMSVPALEILVLLIIVSVCLLFRATKLGLLLTYIFVMHLTWNFAKLNLSLTSLIAYFLLGGLVLAVGFISFIHDD